LRLVVPLERDEVTRSQTVDASTDCDIGNLGCVEIPARTCNSTKCHSFQLSISMSFEISASSQLGSSERSLFPARISDHRTGNVITRNLHTLLPHTVLKDVKRLIYYR
jgi:hypothetical protein